MGARRHRGRKNVVQTGEGVVLSQVSESKPGAPLFVLLDGFFKAMMRAHGIAHGHENVVWSGEVVVLSQVSETRPGAPLFVLLDPISACFIQSGHSRI